MCRRLPAGTSRRQPAGDRAAVHLEGAGAGGAQAAVRRTNEDEDDASTIDAVTASIKAFFPYLMVPQDAVEKVEGFLISSIKQLAADRVIG